METNLETHLNSVQNYHGGYPGGEPSADPPAASGFGMPRFQQSAHPIAGDDDSGADAHPSHLLWPPRAGHCPWQVVLLKRFVPLPHLAERAVLHRVASWLAAVVHPSWPAVGDHPS